MKSIMKLLLICATGLLSMNSFISGESMISQEINFTAELELALAPNPFVISAEKVKELTRHYHLEIEELLQLLVPVARSYARPPISNYKVGIAVLGKSGAIYLGVNLEFPGIPLNASVHGEQFAITNARSHGETELIAIALSAAPCGHCRQFMNEMGGNEKLQLLICNSSAIPLTSLLPDSFGPKDLGLSGNLLTSSKENDSSSTNQGSSLTAKALEAFFASYAPYTDSKSGVAIRTKDGKVYLGSYLENAAFNPSLSPLQAGFISLLADMRDYSEIEEVVLLELRAPKISHENMSRELLRSVAPGATFHLEKLN